MIRVAIVADVRLYREGLVQILSRDSKIRVVATAAQREEALACLSDTQPDVILVDMAFPDSHQVVRLILEHAPAGRVLALGVAEDEGDVLGCAEAGVSGYVPREASVEELVTVIESVARGEAICSPRVAASLLRRVAALAAGQGGRFPRVQLTSREREIVRLIDSGCSNKAIANDLGIEVATVKNHVHNILEKLQVHRRGEAAARVRNAQRGRVSGQLG
ncbi:MAG: LuxR C-terminal-related transcriptional regulator [Gemmatimonadales bacterium]